MVSLSSTSKPHPEPPLGSPLGQWQVPAGRVKADLDDGEVALQGGIGWGSSEPVQWPTGSPWAQEDAGHLLSMLTAGLRLVTPRINTFSGDATPGKTEVSLEQWYCEVQYIKDHYLESVVWESIIRSLNGAAADMAQYMGPTTGVTHILQKLNYFWHSGLFWCSNAELL